MDSPDELEPPRAGRVPVAPLTVLPLPAERGEVGARSAPGEGLPGEQMHLATLSGTASWVT